MCVEEQAEFYMELKGMETEDVLEADGVPAMRCGLARINGAGNIEAVPRSVTALCEAPAFMEDEAGSTLTKRLLVDYLCEKHGEK